MEKTIPTSHCNLAVSITTPEPSGSAQPDTIPLLFIHGNSSCKEVFKQQMADLAKDHQCIAIDLPGHGQSQNATDPATTYCMAGYADAILQAMQALAVNEFYVVGWSLGGHIGIEMMSQSPAVKGLLISGTPPVGHNPEDMANAFLPSEHMALTAQEILSEAEADSYARATCGTTANYESFLGEAVRRTDGRARRMMMESAMRGEGVDQRNMVETDPRPVAVVNGADEPMINNQYLLDLKFKNLSGGTVNLIPGSGHAPFWDSPDRFNKLLRAHVSGIPLQIQE